MPLPDSSTFADYGGEKQDYAAPEDPTTDRSAAELNPALADTAAMTRMIPRARLTLTVSGGVCTLAAHDAVWGNSLAVQPAVIYQATGRYLVSMPITVQDAFGDLHTPNMTTGWANAQDSSDIYSASVRILNGLSFQVLAWNLSSGAAGDPDGPIYVWVA